MKMTCALLFVVITLLGCNPAKSFRRLSCKDSEGVHILVLDEMQKSVGESLNAVDVWMSSYDPEVWNPKFAEEQRRIDKMRQWKDTLVDECLKAQYEDWLWYYQYELNEARSELRDQSHRKQSDDYQARMKAQDDQEKHYRETHGDLPHPPR